MRNLKILIIASALALGTSAIAVAQQGGEGNPANNAAASGGSGTHQTAQKTGTAENDEKVLHNRNGYRGTRSTHHRRHHRRRHQNEE